MTMKRWRDETTRSRSQGKLREEPGLASTHSVYEMKSTGCSRPRQLKPASLSQKMEYTYKMRSKEKEFSGVLKVMNETSQNMLRQRGRGKQGGSNEDANFKKKSLQGCLGGSVG